MLLRNFYNSLACHLFFKASTDTTAFGDGHLNVKSCDGSIFAFNTSKPFMPIGNILDVSTSGYTGTSTEGTYAVFGSGDTAVTFDDYKLASIISTLSGATYTIGTPSYNSTEKKWTNTTTFLLTNTGGESVTIKEIGLQQYVHYEKGGYDHGGLIYREVLETPFTIAAGESVAYTHNFEFTMPTIS